MSPHTQTVSPSDRPTRVRMLMGLAELLGVELTETRLEGFLMALADVALDDLRLGLRRASQTLGEYGRFPVPVELRRAVDAAVLTAQRADAFKARIVEDDDPRVSMHCRDCGDVGIFYRRKADGYCYPAHAPEVVGSHADWETSRCPCVPTNPMIQRRYLKPTRYSEDAR